MNSLLAQLQQFMHQLQTYKPASNVFNPWGRAIDKDYDLSDAANRRNSNLINYLKPRISNAKYIFVAEALGYQGGKFSGIPMTSERIFCGKYIDISATNVIKGNLDFDLLRSSDMNLDLKKATRKKWGFAEPTATTVWRTVLNNNIDLFETILWNIFPFHPYTPKDGTLNNRPIDTNKDDLDIGIIFIKKLLNMNPSAKVIAIGKPSMNKLYENNISCLSVTHPSNGGTPRFKHEIKEIFI